MVLVASCWAGHTERNQGSHHRFFYHDDDDDDDDGFLLLLLLVVGLQLPGWRLNVE